jgi:cbb3-type cytochrome c oxidase subunit II
MSPASRFLRMSYIVAGIGGVAFFALSVALLAIWPGRVLESQGKRMAPEHPLLLSASEQRGRRIYGREGCAYCHTQQVRYVESDMMRFGAPTLAWETRWEYPHLWGTRRIGPDLARESGTRTEDWHFAHLYAPRSVVADSVMPAYASLFEGAPDRPKQDARDLVAYLESLGRAREIAGPEGEARARAACNCDDDEMAQMAFHAAALNASSAKTRRMGETPAMPAGDLSRGRELYAHNCATCHGAQGDGHGPAAAGLHPPPASLVEHSYSPGRLSFVLANGVAGTSMPAWRDFSLDGRAALARAVREFSAPQPEPQIPSATLDLGAQVYRANCAQCHGENGAGDGFAVAELRIVPANLHGVRPSLARSLRVLREGIDGTQMAPWTGRLSEAELSAVAYFVRGFFDGDGR